MRKTLKKWKDLTEQGREDALVWLASRWRHLGEYWSGTPEHAAYQQCADDMLKVMGLGVDGHLLAPGGSDLRLQEQFGITRTPKRTEVAAATANRAIVPGSLVDSDINSHFLQTARNFLQDSYGQVRKEEVAKLSALLFFAYETGFELGEKVGAETAKLRYKYNPKRSK